MKIIEKYYPTGKCAGCGDIIVSDEGEYLLIGWDYHSQQAITIDLKKTTNNVRIYKSTEDIRKEYEDCRIIPSGEITLSFE